MKLVLGNFYLLSTCVWIAFCELSTDKISYLLHEYSVNIEASLNISRIDRELLNSWTEEHQVKQVNVTTRFRLQMSRHKDHSFKRTTVDQKWTKCMDFYSDDVQNNERKYYEEEASCLKNSNKEGKEKRQSVDQLEREMKKWRKSYKYLSHLCEINNINDDEGMKACLVDYIERDNYNSTLQRLIFLKVKAMEELLNKLESSVNNLNNCLETVLSDYLDKVRVLVHYLNVCYNGKREGDSN